MGTPEGGFTNSLEAIPHQGNFTTPGSSWTLLYDTDYPHLSLLACLLTKDPLDSTALLQNVTAQ